MSKIFVYYPQTDSYGIMVIIYQFLEACKRKGIDCSYVTNIEGRKKEDIIIPVLTEPAIYLSRKGFPRKLIILIDAYTLGELNKIKFYFRHGLILKYDFFYSCYAYIKNIFQEWFVSKVYENVLLVSYTDIDYLKKFSSKKTRFLCAPNGVNRPVVSPKSTSKVLRLGILSSWSNRVSYEENDWFIRSIYKKYIKEHKNVELHIAGRGKFLENYRNCQQIKCIGEVDDLNDYFKDIDIFLVVNPKGCGILNRVLDAFSYKTIVLGHEKAFTGFRYMDNAYIEFSDYKSFEDGIDYIVNNPSDVKIKIENAYLQIIEHNDWGKNYDKIVEALDFLDN